MYPSFDENISLIRGIRRWFRVQILGSKKREPERVFNFSSIPDLEFKSSPELVQAMGRIYRGKRPCWFIQMRIRRLCSVCHLRALTPIPSLLSLVEAIQTGRYVFSQELVFLVVHHHFCKQNTFVEFWKDPSFARVYQMLDNRLPLHANQHLVDVTTDRVIRNYKTSAGVVKTLRWFTRHMAIHESEHERTHGVFFKKEAYVKLML
jgi:hypothetical protein